MTGPNVVARVGAMLRAVATTEPDGASTTELGKLAGLARPRRTGCSRHWPTNIWSAGIRKLAAGHSDPSCICSVSVRLSTTT